MPFVHTLEKSGFTKTRCCTSVELFLSVILPKKQIRTDLYVIVFSSFLPTLNSGADTNTYRLKTISGREGGVRLSEDDGPPAREFLDDEYEYDEDNEVLPGDNSDDEPLAHHIQRQNQSRKQNGNGLSSSGGTDVVV